MASFTSLKVFVKSVRCGLVYKGLQKHNTILVEELCHIHRTPRVLFTNFVKQLYTSSDR